MNSTSSGVRSISKKSSAKISNRQRKRRIDKGVMGEMIRRRNQSIGIVMKEARRRRKYSIKASIIKHSNISSRNGGGVASIQSSVANVANDPQASSVIKLSQSEEDQTVVEGRRAWREQPMKRTASGGGEMVAEETSVSVFIYQWRAAR